MSDLSEFTSIIATTNTGTILAQSPRAPNSEGAWYAVRQNANGAMTAVSGLEMALVAARAFHNEPITIIDADDDERFVIERWRARSVKAATPAPVLNWTPQYCRWTGQPLKG